MSEVRKLHVRLWRARDRLFPLGCHPLDLLTPKLATNLLDYDYREDPIPDWPPGRSMKIAGLVDPQRREIVISNEFDPPVMRFTGAHELAHIVLHAPARLLRERPIDGPRLNHQDPREREADIFATLFLMPKQQMVDAFTQTLGVAPPLRMDYRLANLLSPDDPHEVLLANAESLLPMRRLARWSPGTSVHPSLCEQFGVSVTAMAIRLRELKFIQF